MKKLNKDLNIFVSCHKNFYVPDNKFLIPIHVGAKNSKLKLDMQRDDEGENISEKNKCYCELTAQYWAWKNVDCERYGFFHYRRYLNFTNDNHGFFENMTDQNLQSIGLDEENMQKVLGDFDIVAPAIFDFSANKKGSDTLYGQYKTSANHRIEDLDKAFEIILNRDPSFEKYVKKAKNGHQSYFLNMYIMKKKYFFEYASWLFPILDELHDGRDYTFASVYEARTIGLVAERLFTVWMLYIKDKYPNIKIKELQCTFFNDATNPYMEPMFENKIGICMCSDDCYAKHLGIALTSLVDTTSPKNTYDIVIFDNNISVHNKNLLSKTCANKPNISLRFVKTADYVAPLDLNEKEIVKKSTFLRFAILDLMKSYKKVVYLDCDIICNADVANMYDIDLENNYVGACKDSGMACWTNALPPHTSFWYDYLKNTVKLENPRDYFCAGIMIFNIEVMKKHITTAELFKIALENKWEYQDQDVLNFVCQGKVKFLDMNWNYMTFRDIELTEHHVFGAPANIWQQYLQAKENPYIIHYAGHLQPQYCPDVDTAEIYWFYARKSFFYEDVLVEMMRMHSAPKRKKTFKQKLKGFLKKFFPYGTKRGTFARKIWKKIKR